MEEDDDNPPLKGVVVVSLPPANDPSQGKTITAFTVSAPQTHQPDRHQQLTLTPPRPPSRSLSPSPFLSSIRKPLVGFLSFVILALLVWVWVSYEAAFDFLQFSSEVEEEEQSRRREESSFLFPIYRKSGDADHGAAAGKRRMREVGALAGLEREGQISGTGAGVKNRRKFVANSTVLLPVLGNIFPDGIYYTIIHIGNPARPYYLDVDTGSDLTWIQCDAPCSSCAKGPNPLYKPTKGKLVPSIDSLCKDVQSDWKSWYCKSCSQCDYEITYADHSSSMGVLVRDEFPLNMVDNDVTNPSFVFGCGYDQQGQLLASPAKTDGVLGLGSSKVGLSFQLASQNIISNVLGHCIANKEHNGGYMFLGGEFIPHWGMTWVPMLSSHHNFYKAEAQELNYGAQKICTNRGVENLGHVVFDSGSSYSYFTNAAYNNLLNFVEKNMDVLVRDDSDPMLPICWRASSYIRSVEEVKQFFKPLIFHFGNSWLVFPRKLVLHPEDYIIISKKGNVCLGILNGTEVYNGSFNILGDTALRGKLVVYDNVKKKIGWMKSGCSDPHQKSREFSVFF